MKGQAQYRPSFDMVERLQREVIQAKADAQAALHCQDYYYLRYQQQLFRLPKAEYLAFGRRFGLAAARASANRIRTESGWWPSRPGRHTPVELKRCALV